MKPYFSKVLIATLFSSAVEASTTQTYWADGVSESGGWTADLQHPNQCWGAVTGNTIGWWKNNIKTPITFKENTPKDSKGISEWINKTYPNIQNGLMPYRGMEFFFAEFAPDVKLYETHNNKTYDEQFRGPTENSGGPFWTERYGYNGKLTTESLIKNFKTGKVVAALNSETHTVTLWGIEVDEATGKIRKGWITDSVYDRAGKLTMVEVTGNYDETKNMFYFAYNYSIPGTGATVLDAYYIHSVTYVSIDSERNKDISNSNETSTVNNTIPNSGTTETETNNAGTSTDETSTAETEADNKPANTEVSETANAKEVKPAEPTEPVENASDATPTVSPETVVAENTPSQPANENSSEPSVDNTAQPAVETPAKPTAEVVAETSEQPTAVPTPEVVVPESTSSETETVSEIKPAEEAVAENNKQTATSNTEITVSEENSSETTSTDGSASNTETVVLETENTPSQPTNGNSSEPSVDNTAQSAVEMPVVVTEEAKPTESVVAENNEKPTATSNTETTVSEENSSEITSTDSSASNAETVVLETENTSSTPANENSDEPSVDNTAQPAVETPVVATEDAKSTAEAVAETSEQPTAVPTPEVAEPAPEPTPSVASTETATVSEVKPTEPETAERLAVKSLKEAIANYQELSFVTTRVGDVTRYLIQREGIDIALIDPNSKQILVNNTGLVNYDLAQDQNGNIHITKSPNQAAIKEANELTSLHTDLNHVEMNNLNKR
ncbi:hypothetical protein ACN46H_01810, partial [Glaesserella parasuis]